MKKISEKEKINKAQKKIDAIRKLFPDEQNICIGVPLDDKDESIHLGFPSQAETDDFFANFE